MCETNSSIIEREWEKAEWTWNERAEERAPEAAFASESAGGISDQVSRSAVELWGFLTGVLLSISSRIKLSLSSSSQTKKSFEIRLENVDTILFCFSLS